MFSFTHVFNLSVRASWLVLAVVCIRFLLKGAPKAFRCALWALVAVRLLCPISLESSISLVPSREVIPESYLQLEAPAQNAPVQLEIITNPVYDSPATVNTGSTVNQVQNWDLVATVVWFAGMGAMALYALYSFLSIRLRVRMAGWVKGNIWSCDNLDSPFILGLFRPRIYLPSALDEATRTHVLAHEKAHLKRLDHLWKPLGFALLTVHWFNPLMWLAYTLLCRDIELACDEKVIKKLDKPTIRAYSEALVACSVSHRMIAVCPLAFGEVGVKGRIRSMLSYKKPGFWLMTAALIALIAAAVCFLTDPARIPQEVSRILEQDGITITSSAEEPLVLTLDKTLLPEDVLNGKKHEIEPGTIVLRQYDSTAITVTAARMSGDELLLECQFDHTVSDSGSILLPYDPLDDSVGHDIHVQSPETALVRGKGKTSFSLCIQADAYKEADREVTFQMGGIYQVTYAREDLPVARLLDRELHLAEVLYSDRDEGFLYTPEGGPVYVVCSDLNGKLNLSELHDGALVQQYRPLGTLCVPTVTANDFNSHIHGEHDLHALLNTKGVTAWSVVDTYTESLYQYLLLLHDDGTVYLGILRDKEPINLYRLTIGETEQEPVVLAGAYTLDRDLNAPYFLLGGDGSFAVNLNPAENRTLRGSYVQDREHLTLHTEDGRFWQLRLDEFDRLVFDAQRSSPFPVELAGQAHYLVDGAAFNPFTAATGENGMSLMGLAPGETWYSSQTMTLEEDGAISYEIGYLSPMAELVVGFEDSSGKRTFQTAQKGYRQDTIPNLPAGTYRVYVTNTGTSGGLEPLSIEWGSVRFTPSDHPCGILSGELRNQDSAKLYESPLDQAITQAIHRQNRTEQSDSRICTAAFRIMDKVELCVDGDPGMMKITAYLQTCYHEYSMESGTLHRETEVFTPAVAVFEEQNGEYTLTEYFTPNPENYEADIASRFTWKARDYLYWVKNDEIYMPEECLELARLRLESGDLAVPEDILTIRHYAPVGSDDLFSPYFTLCSDGTFKFTENLTSSYMGTGTYALDYWELVLKTSDGRYTWVFDVADGQFLFDAERSSRVEYYPNGGKTPAVLPDGTPFAMTGHTERLPEETTSALLDAICSSPAQSSNPGDYIAAHPEEYALLLRCADSTIRYCFTRFAEGRQTDLRGHIMASLCRDIIGRSGNDCGGGVYMTGQDWFDAFAAQAEDLRAAANSADYPYHAFALECLGK